MADTCSGIYFWSWSTPLRPPSVPGWRAAAVHERRLEPVLSLRLNSMVTLVVLFIGCVPSLRRRATTSQPLHTDVVPSARWGERKEGGALCLCKKISILTRVEIRLVYSFAREERDNFSTYLWDGVVWFGEIWKRRFFSSNIICITCVI